MLVLTASVLCDVMPQFHLLLCLWGDSSGNDTFCGCWEVLMEFHLLSLADNNGYSTGLEQDTIVCSL